MISLSRGSSVAKDKVMFAFVRCRLKRTFASTAEGRRELTSWLRRRKVGKAVMEASGRLRARLGQSATCRARSRYRIVDPKRVRSFAQSAGRLAKNDTIDAEMIAWFAETFGEARGQAYDATREQLHQMVNARQAMRICNPSWQARRTCGAGCGARMHARISKTIAVELVKIEAEITALIQATPHFANSPRSSKAFRDSPAPPLLR